MRAVVLACVALAATLASGCSFRSYRVYGPDVEQEQGVRAVFWPVDATGLLWRYVVEQPDEVCGRTEGPTVTWHRTRLAYAEWTTEERFGNLHPRLVEELFETAWSADDR